MGRRVSVLLDTHVFLWAVMQPDLLSTKVRKLLENPATELVVSAASTWEIAIKYRLGRLPDARPVVADFDAVVRRLDARVLGISHLHALRAGEYRQLHRDPFDRVLAAQAEIEGLPLVSRDPALRQFGVDLVW
ncbi:MAG: type II toxin-antitoxin system VapC family toxin [Gammaproteobacteria bacterium]|nr:type II toxin-antitoxin system VapC family toxin [Gammaproteobacteria bacterium]